MGARLVVARLALPLAAAGCDSATPPGPDAPAGGAVTAHVIAPDGGEVLYAAEPVTVRWTGEDAMGGSLRYDVELIDAGSTVRVLGTAVFVASGQIGELAWTPIGVPAPTPYRIRITATSERGETASDESDDVFTVSPPAQGVSFAADLQPILTARCTTKFCHDKQSQVAVLDLTAGAAYEQLVDVPSRENPCTSYMRVRPGVPNQSYLVFKLEGAGACLYGVRMPKDAPALASADITAIRDWIAAGAPNN